MLHKRPTQRLRQRAVPQLRVARAVATAAAAAVAAAACALLSGVPACGGGVVRLTRADPASAAYFESVFTGYADVGGLLKTLNLSHPGLAASGVPGPARECLATASSSTGTGHPEPCEAAAAALLGHFRNASRGWRVVSHMFRWMRDVRVADLAAANTTERFGGASAPRRVEHGPRGINWTHNPFWETEQDAEWAWAMHRQPFWMSLAFAFAKTGEARYFDAWASQFGAWVSQCPRDPFFNYDWGVAWALDPATRLKVKTSPSRTWPNPRNPRLSWAWRRVDAGRRALQFSELLRAFLPAPGFSPALLVKALRSVHEHGEFLAGNPHHDFTRDNHGLFEAEGAAALGVLFPEFSAAARWRDRSFGVLRREMSRQVRPDGMQLENSVGYQASTIRILTDTPVLAERNGLPGFPAWYWLGVGRMLEALGALALPSGESVQFGDQASRVNVTTTLRHLWPVVHAKTGWAPPPKGKQHVVVGATVAGGGTTGDGADEGAWRRPETAHLPQSGFFTVRGGPRGADATMLALRCGPSYNAHSHKDAGAFELASRGRVLLSDSGCFTYSGIKETVPSSERRRYYQSTAAHNTLTLDGRDAHAPSMIGGPYRKLKGYDDCGVLLRRSADDHAVVVVENRATYREPAELSHRRAVVYFARADAFVLVDEAIGPAEGLVEVHFHLEHDHVMVDRARAAAYTGTNGTNVFVRSWAGGPSSSPPPPSSSLSSPALNTTRRVSHQSPAMGKQRERPAVSFGQRKGGSASAVRFVTVVAPFDGSAPPDLLATADGPPGSPTVTVTLWRRGGRGTAGEAEVDTASYSFDPEGLAMSPPPDELAPLAEQRYKRYYDNFRRQRRALRECREACEPRVRLVGNETHVRDARRSLVHVPSRRFVYCGIPKCGVSRWRRLARRVEGVAGWADRRAHNPRDSGLRYVAHVVEREGRGAAEAVLNDPSLHAFVIVRNPFTRLLSSWLDKKDFPQFGLPQDFGAFVRWVAKQPDAQLNEHFAPMVTFCGLSEGVRFDAVYRLEDVDAWGPQLVRRLNISDAVGTGWKGGFFRSRNFTHNHFSERRVGEFYTDELRRLVAERYRADFDMFGYSPDERP